MNIQIMPLDCDYSEFFASLRDTGLGKRFVVDCNGITGIGCDADDLDQVLELLGADGYYKVHGHCGSPEQVAAVYVRRQSDGHH